MDLLYNPATHTYRHGIDGPVMEHVTGIINVDTRWFTEESRIKGQHIHRMINLYEKDDLVEETLEPAYVGYLTAYRRAKAETGMVVLESEMKVHSDVYLYGGTLDLLVQFPKVNLKTIIDVKSGAYSGWTELQTAGYAICFPDPVARAGLELRENGTYRLWTHKNRQNIQEFLTLLMAQRIRTKYNLKEDAWEPLI
jgi:hypothetical protein